MKRRIRMCTGCPFNAERTFPPIDDAVMTTIHDRIATGEQWVCHQTCDGSRVTARSMLCAGVA